MKPSIQGFWRQLKAWVKDWKNDYQRLFAASKGAAVLVVIVEGLLGLAFLAEVHILWHLIDAMIGAQGIQIITSDITKYLWQQIGLFIALLPLFFVHHQFTGLVARIGERVRTTVFVLGLIPFAMQVSPIVIPLILLSALVEAYLQNKIFTLIFAVASVLVASTVVRSVLFAGALRFTSVGEALFLAGSVMALVGFLALRPYLSVKKENARRL